MNDFRLRTMKPRYQELFDTCKIRSSWLPRIEEFVQKIVSLRSTYYEAIQAQTTAPWWFIGILHYREATFAETHLHNGDPLTGRTYHVPAGRPEAPPANGIAYTFVESAVDALRLKTYDQVQDRSIPAWLWRFEMWNGWGYAMRGINSEYLWNGTNHFGSGNNRGKFVADGRFDPNATSEQVGAATLLWYFHYKGMLDSGVEDSSATSSSSFSSLDLSFSSSLGVEGSINLGDSFQGNSTGVGQLQTPIQLAEVFGHYQRLPHQDAAIAWLQQQQPQSILAEFTRLWRSGGATGVSQGQPQLVTMAMNPLPVAAPVIATPPKPRTLAEGIIAYCEEKGYQIDRGTGQKNIIYVEGMYPNGQLNEDTFNAWNDTRMVIEIKNGIPEIIQAWEATTEPGRYYTMNPMNINGAARIAFGQYTAWIVGVHLNNHEALVQAGPVTVCRDLNKDGMRIGDRQETGSGFGINQHWGGDSPKDDIGRWSAGCLVGRTRDGHREFMSIIKQDPRYKEDRGYIFRTIVIPGDDLLKRFPPS
jgi:lysozyme family protein